MSCSGDLRWDGSSWGRTSSQSWMACAYLGWWRRRRRTAAMAGWWQRQLLETVKQRRMRGSSGARGTVVARPAVLVPGRSYRHRVRGRRGRHGRCGRARGTAHTATGVGRAGALARPRDGDGHSWRSSCCRRQGWPARPRGGDGRSRRRLHCRRRGWAGWALVASGASSVNGCRGRRRGSRELPQAAAGGEAGAVSESHARPAARDVCAGDRRTKG